MDVENLEAQFKLVEVAQTMSEHNIDDSQLGRVKDLIADVRARLNVAERLANTEVNFNGEIPVSTPQSENIVDQVTEVLQRGNGYAASGRNRAQVDELESRTGDAVRRARWHRSILPGSQGAAPARGRLHPAGERLRRWNEFNGGQLGDALAALLQSLSGEYPGRCGVVATSCSNRATRLCTRGRKPDHV